VQGVAIPDQKPAYHALELAANGAVKRELKREAPSSSQTSDTKRARPTKAKAAVANSSDNEGSVPKKKAKPRKKRVRAEGERSDMPTNNPFNKPMNLR
jgi:hypothetical protein